MCGIAGIFNNNQIPGNARDIVEQMNKIQKHRGPDDTGIYSDNNCALGHVRLSIIDLSKDGHQPFFSTDKNYVLTYNGEIYNFIELRQELELKGYIFRTKTDTEVLINAYIEWGINCLSKFNGMFAFAIYDIIKNIFFIARDRVGIKPFYYLYKNNTFYFASEIKAFLVIPNINLTLNNLTLFDYLCFNRTDIFDETFTNEISRLPKGHYGIIDKNDLEIKKWWSSFDFLSVKTNISFDEAIKTTENIFLSAVELHMRSDVPTGSCLSGGLDSTILLGIIHSKQLATNGFKTFTASFPGTSYDECSYIELLQKKYQFENFRTYPTADGALKNLNEFVYYNDEPTTSPTFYSQFEVMRLAKDNGVTVLLDGQGGDENFAGYQYFHGFNFTGLYKQKQFGKLLIELYKSFIRKQEKEAFQTFLFQILPSSIKKKLLLKTLPYINKDFFYTYIDKSKIFNEFFSAENLNHSLALHFQYKLEHLLRMEDRNSMAFQIESRVPYLDYRLIEYLLSLPANYKIRNGETKFLQKKALENYTIPEIINRKDKLGFATPGKEWMKTNRWESLTIENYKSLCEKMPSIFNKHVSLKDNLYEKWKVNQLYTWQKIFNVKA
ncbi:MAG: asparagine synthase (glutamine-hydrolyzing) [Bacteroidetes bacterium GWA2_30_7]|nr:MAG: asparagine synthase (glutamine-hydrolyzing) [Bacteroidetes bacterium GWA2_30_7]